MAQTPFPELQALSRAWSEALFFADLAGLSRLGFAWLRLAVTLVGNLLLTGDF